MVLLKRRNISELCAMKQWKHWQAIVAERSGCLPEVRHYLWPDGFPRMVTMPLTQPFSLKYFP